VKPLVTFPDPEAVVRSYLAGAYPEGEKPTTVSTEPPAARLAAGATHLQVELAGTFVGDYPAVERATVRLNCYAGPGQRSVVKAMATRAQGLLSTHPGDATVFGTLPLVGRSSVIADPATQNLMVFCTFRVNLRPTQTA
jgi:hypothetical protein